MLVHCGVPKKGVATVFRLCFGKRYGSKGVSSKDRFPRAYALDTCRLITVGHKLSHLSLTESFRRIPRDGIEKTQVDNLKALLLTVSLNDSQDKWNWDKSKSGIYSVASARMVIDSQSLPQRRGIDIESLSCVNCDTGVVVDSESLYYSSWIDNIKMPKSNKSMLEGVFYVTWWLLWNFRNKKIFEGHNIQRRRIVDEVILSILFIGVVYRSNEIVLRDGWIKNPSLFLCKLASC
ncbi:hypothetical protein Tco_1516936 [Tanacetum coccineum]